MMHQNKRLTHLHQLSWSMGAMLATVTMGSVYFTENAMALPNKFTSKNMMAAIPTSIEVNQSTLFDRLYGQIADEEAVSSDETSSTETSTSGSSNPRFTCQYDDSQYTVMYSPESASREYYAWAIPEQMGGGWTPERRCNAIAERLELYRPDGLLELQTGEENNLDIVCVTTSQNDDCRIVFTVPEGQDPIDTRDRVFENLAVANSGQETSGVSTFHGNSSASSIWGDLGNLGLDLPQLPRQNSRPLLGGRSQGIDLRPFLAPTDGGTGSNL